MGAELKNSFALLKGGRAILSQHMGDLENAPTFRAYHRTLELYRGLFDHKATAVAVDRHPDYLSTQLGLGLAEETGIKVIEVQHHHAHIVSCMAEHGLPADAGAVLGIALDGLGYGAEGELWGAEFLRADYLGYERLAAFDPVAMPGGAQAMREPWRNAYAHLRQFIGWNEVAADFPQLEIVQLLQGKPLANLQRMIERGLNSPPASSCGRLFDAVAAVLGICVERQSFEGQAAMEMEALAAPLFHRYEPYPELDGADKSAPARIRFEGLWRAILDDLQCDVDRCEISARFHQSICQVIADTAVSLCHRQALSTVVLSGGVFQNRLLLEGVGSRLRQAALRVISPKQLPANDGGLALGQALVAAARMLRAN
jgi:hydrogenase maturation protein HypF